MEDWDYPTAEDDNYEARMRRIWFGSAKENNVKDVDARVEEILRERLLAAKVEERLKLVETFGKDNYSEGAVLRFQKLYQENGKAYSYVAIKCNDKWYATGPRIGGTPLTWGEFVAWLVRGVPVVKLEPMVPSWMAPSN